MARFFALDKTMLGSERLLKFYTPHVRQAIIEAIKEVADKTLRDVAKKYPAWKSMEKTTSSIRGESGYSHEFGYVNNQELETMKKGRKAQMVSGVYLQKVPRHQRQIKRGGRPRKITVEAHTRRYQSNKPVMLATGEWRVVSAIPGFTAQNPLVIINNGNMDIKNFTNQLKSQLRKAIPRSKVT